MCKSNFTWSSLFLLSLCEAALITPAFHPQSETLFTFIFETPLTDKNRLPTKSSRYLNAITNYTITLFTIKIKLHRRQETQRSNALHTTLHVERGETTKKFSKVQQSNEVKAVDLNTTHQKYTPVRKRPAFWNVLVIWESDDFEMSIESGKSSQKELVLNLYRLQRLKSCYRGTSIV